MINVYIVDDNVTYTEVLKAFIEQSGIAQTVCCFHDLSSCRQAMAETQPDVLLLDMRLPLEAGFGPEIIGHVFAAEMLGKYPNLKILAISISDQLSVIRDTLKSGAHGYVTKNISGAELLKAINTVCQGSVYLSEDVRNILETPEEDTVVLTRSEKSVLRLLAQGLDEDRIAKTMKIHKKSVATHLNDMMLKLDARNQTVLLLKAKVLHLFD